MFDFEIFPWKKSQLFFVSITEYQCGLRCQLGQIQLIFSSGYSSHRSIPKLRGCRKQVLGWHSIFSPVGRQKPLTSKAAAASEDSFLSTINARVGTVLERPGSFPAFFLSSFSSSSSSSSRLDLCFRLQRRLPQRRLRRCQRRRLRYCSLASI